MFSFTTVATSTVALIQDSLGLISPTTLIGGVVTAAITGTLLMRFLRGMRQLAK